MDRLGTAAFHHEEDFIRGYVEYNLEPLIGHYLQRTLIFWENLEIKSVQLKADD
jgi:hypothetical protein